MTPSTMPARIASMRARSRACSAEPAADLLHRVVERPRDGAELVVAEAEARRREIAAAIALAPRRRSAARGWPMRAEKIHAMAAPPSSARPSAVSVAREHRLQLLADVGQRQRHAHERDRRMAAPAPRRTACRSSASRCSAARGRCPVARASTTSGRCAWFSIAATRLERLRRVADDAAVGGDEA